MSNLNITDEVLDKIAVIVANDIGAKVMDGINWTFVLDTDTVKINEYESIRESLRSLGYKSNEVLRAFKVPNGIVYDIDADVVKKLVTSLMSQSEKADTCYSIMKTAYEERRNSEFAKLQVFIIKAIKNGKKNVSLALFNKNKGSKIVYKVKVTNGIYKGKFMEITLDAFALRHWDLEELNQNYLIPARCKIKRIEVIDILPTLTGVGFNMELEELVE